MWSQGRLAVDIYLRANIYLYCENQVVVFFHGVYAVEFMRGWPQNNLITLVDCSS